MRMASLSAPSIVPSRWRMTRIQTRISHVRPTASIHQRGTLLRLCCCGVLRAGRRAMLWRNRVLVTRSEATVDGSCSDDSEFEEERAGGGPGPSRRRAGAGGPGGGSVPTTSIRSAGGALTNRMAAETLGVRADIACVLYICTLAVTTTPKWC